MNHCDDTTTDITQFSLFLEESDPPCPFDSLATEAAQARASQVRT